MNLVLQINFKSSLTKGLV